MGDPCGVGPEIVVKALAGHAGPVVIAGDHATLARTADACGVALALRRVEPGEWPRDAVGVVDVAPVPEDLPIGTACAAGGEAAWRSSVRASTSAEPGARTCWSRRRSTSTRSSWPAAAIRATRSC